jgi:hypothetical protein
MFDFLKYANADNEYLRAFSYLILFPEEKYVDTKADEDKDSKFFYINAADKIPLLLIIVPFFILVFTLDHIPLK